MVRAHRYIQSAKKFGRALGYSIAMTTAKNAFYYSAKKGYKEGKNFLSANNNGMPFNSTSTYASRSNKTRVGGKRKRATRRRALLRRRTRKGNKTSLKKQVKQIKRQLNADSARHVYKAIGSTFLISQINQSNYSTIDVVTGSLIETYMANLRYYDPAAPGTLVTAAGATGTYQRELHFKNIHGSLEIRNNYQVPCKVKVYLVQPKGDTNITPTTYYNNSITDQLIGGGTIVTNGIYPTDLNAFMAQWKCKCIKDVSLDAGAYTVVSHNTGSFRYDPSLFDSHSLEYQNKFKSFSFFVRVEGVLGHDTSAAQYTNLSGGVDIATSVRAEIIYDAGINLDDLYLSNSRAAAFTNGGVVTNKPIADNQAPSVA